MKQNKKGFTLIELLAVIVILAIIALIATPIILNMISRARAKAAESSALGFVDSIEYYTNFRSAASDLGIGSEYTVDAPTGTCKRDSGSWTSDTSSIASACGSFMTEVRKKSKGQEPKDDSTFTINADGKVTAASLIYDGGTCTYDGTKCS